MSSGTGATPEHEHEFEAAPGLPESLPPGERILWQGRPAWRAVARDVFHLRAVAWYFAALLGLRIAFSVSEGATAGQALLAGAPVGALFAFALAMLAVLSQLSARTTLYTLTNRRLVMRVGIVLTLTFNLPLRRLQSAGLRLRGDAGTGDIPVRLAAGDKIAFVHLWPHVRPWHLAHPEPMLRCVPDAARVAQILREAWSREAGVALASAGTPERTAPSRGGAHALTA